MCDSWGYNEELHLVLPIGLPFYSPLFTLTQA